MVELSEGFWMGVLATAAGVLGLIIRSLSRSKCDNIEFCCIKIHRNIDAEVMEERYEREHPSNEAHSV